MTFELETFQYSNYLEASEKWDGALRRSEPSQVGIYWCKRCRIELDPRTPCVKCKRERGHWEAESFVNVRFESEETILSEVGESIRRDFIAMVRSEQQMKSKFKSGKRRDMKKELKERSINVDW